ncbi:hypothetical protein GALMADRAFT_212794 [Galerina marginata CBS 339.88]|uniref:Uncharacterized protein n=1 Tax=Galerina marginata (strain CBS 339.88) TaxID=685588 RepID=A0A067STL9_GALM3|nr:hypothetical protein GALMADRAFT_212794 [Galerina marginata CBS 339.88]
MGDWMLDHLLSGERKLLERYESDVPPTIPVQHGRKVWSPIFPLAAQFLSLRLESGLSASTSSCGCPRTNIARHSPVYGCSKTKPLIFDHSMITLLCLSYDSSHYFPYAESDPPATDELQLMLLTCGQTFHVWASTGMCIHPSSSILYLMPRVIAKWCSRTAGRRNFDHFTVALPNLWFKPPLPQSESDFSALFSVLVTLERSIHALSFVSRQFTVYPRQSEDECSPRSGQTCHLLASDLTGNPVIDQTIKSYCRESMVIEVRSDSLLVGK